MLLCSVRMAYGDLDKEAVTAHLEKLKSADEGTRIESLRAIQTSCDGRIPEATLPLLRDTGSSTRRIACRTIGSRWWQISKERIPEFIKALKVNTKSEYEDEKNMAVRAVGLLKRDYKSDMFSRSASKKWVIYERRGQPCLIEVESDSENLVGWHPDDGVWFAPSWSNSSLAGSSNWHPKEDKVALSIILNRRASTLWVWRHPWPDKTRVRKFTPEELVKALGMKGDALFYPGGFSAEFKAWKGDELQMELYFTSSKSDDDFTEHTAEIGWDSTKDTFRVISRKDEQQ